VPSTYFAGLDLPLTPKDAVSPYRREDHGPEIRTIKKLMIVQFAGAVLADVLLRYGTGNGQLASVMFALVFGHMAARIAPRRVALRRKLAILRMKADQLSMDPYVPPDMLEQAVDQVRARLNRLASVDLIVVPFTAAFLGLSQLLVGIDVLPRTFASWPHFSIPAVIAFAAFHEWRFRSYMNSLFPLPARAQAGE
jgi:hypothetical protein